MLKYLSYAKINSVNPLYLIINKINGYNEGSNGNKYLRLVYTDESKDAMEKHEELQDKIRVMIRSITNNSDNDDKKYMKTKVSLSNDVSLKAQKFS